MARPKKISSLSEANAIAVSKTTSPITPVKVQKVKCPGAPSKAARKAKPDSAMKGIYTRGIRKKTSKTTEKLGVLYRPTVKTLKATEARKTSTDKVESRVLSVMNIKQPAKGKNRSYDGPPFHDVLPTAILQQICRLVVVQSGRFVYPLWETEREQPDLAMTCRHIRSIALPVFYAENPFAFQLPPSTALAHQINRPLMMSNKWMLAVSAWTNHIQDWIFTDEEVHADEFGGSGSLVKITLPATPSCFSQAVQGESAPSPRVEVHEDAGCLMQYHASVRCSIMRNPTWLNDAIIKHMRLTDGYSGIMSPAALTKLQICLRGGADDLSKHRCKPFKRGASGTDTAQIDHGPQMTEDEHDSGDWSPSTS